jgi:hypothetical protein
MQSFRLASCGLLIGIAGAALAAEPAPTPAAPTVATPTATDVSQEIVCRKEKETGSLVKTKKTCHSRAQWAYIDDVNRNFSRQMVEDGTTRPAGN